MKVNKVILCYNICRSIWPPWFRPISVRSMLYTPKSLFLRQSPCSVCQNPNFYANIYLFGFLCPSNVHWWVLVVIPQSVTNDSTCMIRGRGVGGRGHVVSEKVFASVLAKLFWHTIYCAKPRPNPESTVRLKPIGNKGIRKPESPKTCMYGPKAVNTLILNILRNRVKQRLDVDRAKC